MQTNFTSIAIIAFLHLKFGYVQPLIMQSILGFKTFFMTKEARIHFFHASTSSGELRRPFRIEGPDRKSTRLNSSHSGESRMPSSA